MAGKLNRPLYDSLVIGGGPAGLSAALQLARSNRPVAVVDSGSGRSTFRQTNHNYLGFPGGITARELRERGRAQVSAYPVALLDGAVSSLRCVRAGFRAELEGGHTVTARTVILATGVTDNFPPDCLEYVGRSLFWCIVCDGYAARGKNVVAIGNDEEAAVTALQFLQFTSTVTLVTGSAACDLDEPTRRKLRRHGVTLVTGEIRDFVGDDGIVCELTLASGARLPADLVFSLQGASPNNALALGLGAATDAEGFVTVDEEQHTSVSGLFAAGDVTHRHAHQVATAVHEGLTAATAAQHFLYEPWQR